ncbi:hypothetical protein [Aestuariivirga sp.]|uniref:hypothetical protein n=1 Tax=Aestuariivirga sp. TaxID=2650926 RepID=UPI0039E62ED4
MKKIKRPGVGIETGARGGKNVLGGTPSLTTAPVTAQRHRAPLVVGWTVDRWSTVSLLEVRDGR